MDKPIENTPGTEANVPAEKTVETPVEPTEPKGEPAAQPKAPEEPQKTIGEMGEIPQPKVVEEHVFVAEKKARKAAERELKALKKSIESGATAVEISEEMAEISEEYDIDPSFLQRFAAGIKAETERELEAKFGQKAGAEKFDTAFDNALRVALERGPEFSKLVNPEVIKSLARLPQNSNKTVSQLLEETYGNALTGKRTIETTTPGGGKDPEPLDFDKARKDNSYFNEVMKNPKLKKEYNEEMLKRGF